MVTPIGSQDIERFIVSMETQLQQLRELNGLAKPPVTKPAPAAPVKPQKLHKQTRRPIQLAPGYSLRTRPNSLYTMVLRTQAKACHLDHQKELFASFAKSPTVAAARSLLKRIAIRKDDLLVMVKSEPEYQQHCDRQTERYFARAAGGDAKAQRVINNSAIFRDQKKWVGDFDEVFTVLFTGRNPANLRRCKNVQILNKAHLAWDRLYIGAVEYVVLYPVKFYATFQKVKALSASLTSL